MAKFVSQPASGSAEEIAMAKHHDVVAEASERRRRRHAGPDLMALEAVQDAVGTEDSHVGPRLLPDRA